MSDGRPDQDGREESHDCDFDEFEAFEEYDDGSAELATVLGISEEQLWDELDAGKSYAEIAQANGVDVQKVIDTLVAAEAKFIDEMVTAGEITAEEAADQRPPCFATATSRPLESCYRCLRPGHRSRECKSKASCTKCSRDHHPTLHLARQTAQEPRAFMVSESTESFPCPSDEDVRNDIFFETEASAGEETEESEVFTMTASSQFGPPPSSLG